MYEDGQAVAMEPRTLSQAWSCYKWPQPRIMEINDGNLKLINNTKCPMIIHKHDQICHVRSTKTVIPPKLSIAMPKPSPIQQTTLYSSEVTIDPDNQLSQQCRHEFQKLIAQYDHVFEPTIKRYNDNSGKVRARIHITVNKPPTRKLQVPNYCHKDQQLLQDKFDQLEQQGVFVRPEVAGVVVEHVSPSFLIHKKSGAHRLVTSFVALSPYCKVLPTTMPTVESVLRTIASWKFIIVTDLADAFYQIQLDPNSMKWCATPTPFRGLRCYAVAAQGMPGASEALEECMSAVFGQEVKDRVAGKIADDMCIGGQTEEDLLHNWTIVLDKLSKNNLGLKALKTFIAPLRTQLLGWDWHMGTLTASTHKISPLYSAEPPETVTKLRSFIGAYKFFNRVVPQCASHINELESSISGKQKNDKINWSDHLIQLYRSAQDALKKASTIHLPRHDDQLIIVHDGSMLGIGSVLYLNREDHLVIGSFFSAKLKDHQTRWYPCEIEALSITVSIQHFGPYIRESDKTTQVLTDSRPCVQAWERMRRGQFSTSARVATFMSTLAEFNVEVQHISGVQNLPSDFQSRNPPECNSPSCQICKFIVEANEIIVRSITVEEIMSGRAKVPYDNRVLWKHLQMECPDLVRVHTHSKHGTRPTAKRTKVTTVKRYLSQGVIISKDGVLVVVHSEPFFPPTELIVVPEHLIHGLLTSLHLTLNHATTLQLLKVFKRQFFALKSQHYAKECVDNCHTCRSLKTLPKELHQQSTTDLPVSPCRTFSADVVRRFRQKIFVLRETFSSFTVTSLHPNEEHGTLRTALTQSVSQLRPNPQTTVEVRVDNAPGFNALKNDVQLKKLNIHLDFGRVKNPNKNPVVDKGIQELISEILKFNVEAGPVSADSLAIVTNQLNSRIRGRGLTSWEILYQRDHESGSQLDIDDNKLSQLQEQTRITNQIASAKHKAGGGPVAQPANVVPGSLVYIKNDCDKNRGRERYIVVRVQGNECVLKKVLKSQIRQKEYVLKLTEVMLVSPNTICRRDFDHGLDSSDEEEVFVNDSVSSPGSSNVEPPGSRNVSDHPVVDHTIQGQPDIDDSLPQPVMEESEDQASEAEEAVQDATSVATNTTLPDSSRRSTRLRKKPGWMED